uniref:Uncharacterized protein n=1 Tax=viral metagenome TaxID=1070528 RepID=A0A6M3KJA5_9ZZZZ
MKHTELPWKVSRGAQNHAFSIESGSRTIALILYVPGKVLTIAGRVEEANAALIIEAVNNHHALKHACKLALDALTTTYENGKGVVDAQVALHAFGNLKAALDAAGKEV